MIAIAKPDNQIDALPLGVVVHGDALAVLKTMESNSVDAIVTDPPAGISFMGKEWDNFTGKECKDSTARRDANNRGKGAFLGNQPFSYSPDSGRTKAERDAFIAFLTSVMAEALRVLKPGGHALVWALPRTSHWTALALEDAGFELKDAIFHHFGSGFPKSHDISKAIDKMNGNAFAWRAFSSAYAEAVKNSSYTHSDIDKHLGIKSSSCYWARLDHRGGMPPRHHWEKVQSLLNLSPDFERLYDEAEREVIGKNEHGYKAHYGNNEAKSRVIDITAPATPEAQQWSGFGTALKPSTEIWWLCRKPLAEPSIAANVLKWSTGAINIDGCRVGATDKAKFPTGVISDTESVYGNGKGRYEDKPRPADSHPSQRWPANLLLSHSLWCTPNGTKRVRSHGHFARSSTTGSIFGNAHNLPTVDYSNNGYADPDGMEEVEDWQCAEDCPIRLLDEQGGWRSGGGGVRANRTPNKIYGNGNGTSLPTNREPGEYASKGGYPSRYFTNLPPDVPFLYTSKSSRRERNAGCEGLPEVEAGVMDKRPSGDFHTRMGDGATKPAQNTHPTVKSTSLMRWLVRLITPPDGIVLDCFAGSGSTLVACIQEGFHFIGIEAEEDYVRIAEARIAHARREV